VLDAAQKSIRSAAFDSAARYLRSANESLPVLKAETWTTNRDNCLRICTLATAIAAGLRDTSFAFSAVGGTVAEARPVYSIAKLHVFSFRSPKLLISL
jgi:hypothetical protein